jgi:hypothetical protein
MVLFSSIQLPRLRCREKIVDLEYELSEMVDPKKLYEHDGFVYKYIEERRDQNELLKMSAGFNTCITTNDDGLIYRQWNFMLPTEVALQPTDEAKRNYRYLIIQEQSRSKTSYQFFKNFGNGTAIYTLRDQQLTGKIYVNCPIIWRE